MITLYSYPGLFGVADNNPFGLKVFAVLRLGGLEFRHEHVFDASHAPHGQLPYIQDGDEIVGDSSAIIAHLTDRHGLAIDKDLTASQRAQAFFIDRVLDDLYWTMSYSRWKDDRYWPLFCGAMLREHAELTEASMEKARAYNLERYRYQGIGRYAPQEAYRRGLDDLTALAGMLGEKPFLFGDMPASVDASLYGFVANILFYPIDTPLRDYVMCEPKVVGHCRAIHSLIQDRETP